MDRKSLRAKLEPRNTTGLSKEMYLYHCTLTCHHQLTKTSCTYNKMYYYTTFTVTSATFQAD